MVSELIELGCGSYNHVDKCYRLMPQRMLKFEEITNATTEHYPFTVLIPILDIVDRLDSDEDNER